MHSVYHHVMYPLRCFRWNGLNFQYLFLLVVIVCVSVCVCVYVHTCVYMCICVCACSMCLYMYVCLCLNGCTYHSTHVDNLKCQSLPSFFDTAYVSELVSCFRAFSYQHLLSEISIIGITYPPYNAQPSVASENAHLCSKCFIA